MELPSLNRQLFSSSDADELQQEELQRVTLRENQLKRRLGYV